MTKLSLGLDLDGVVADWNKGFRRAFLDRGDMPEPLDYKALDLLNDHEGINSWDFVHDVVGEKNWKWFWQVAVPTGRVFARLPAFPQALNYTRNLCQAHGVFIVTTRPSAVRNETYGWMGRHGLNPQAIIHVDHKVARNFGGGQDKATLINTLGLAAMLEDNADTAVNVAEETLAGSFLIDRPWNRHLDHPKVTRVRSIAKYQRLVEEWA